jgi:hypothetical protein
MAPAEDEKEVSYTIGFAKADLEGLHAPSDLVSAVDQSWEAGAEVTRYGRRWTLSRVLESDEQGVYGKIGFVKAGQLETLSFDRKQFDFVRGEAQSGVVVPFLISSDLVVSYQLIGSLVKENTFINALEDLLNQNMKALFAWRVSPLTFEITYEDWRQSVAHVTRFDLRLEQPNPHYHGDQIAEDLVEGLRTEYTRLTGVARDETVGIETNSTAFRQALDHVLRNYGKATLVGVDSDGAQSVFVKLRDAVSRISARVRVSAPGGPEVPRYALRAARSKLPFSAQTASPRAEDSTADS